MLHVDMIYFVCRDRSMPAEDKFKKKSKFMNHKTQTDRKIKKNDALGKRSSNYRWYKSCNWMTDTHTYPVLVLLYKKGFIRTIIYVWKITMFDQSEKTAIICLNKRKTTAYNSGLKTVNVFH